MPSLPRVAALAFVLFALLAISSSTAAKTTQRVNAKLQAQQAAEAEPEVAKPEINTEAKPAEESSGVQQIAKGARPERVEPEKVVVDAQAKKHHKEEAPTQRNKVDVHINVNVKHHAGEEALTQEDAEAIRAQIVKQISTTSTKPDTADDANAVRSKQKPEEARGKPHGTQNGPHAAGGKQETPDQKSVEVADNAAEPQAKVALAAVEQKPATEAAPAAGGSTLLLLGLPILAAVAVFAAVRHRQSDSPLPEFIETQLSNIGLSSCPSKEQQGFSTAGRSIYGSV